MPYSQGLQTLLKEDPEHPKTRENAEALVKRVEGLKDKFHVVIAALPGFGETEKLPNRANLNSYAEEVFAFQKTIGMENAIIFGSSMGGIIATKMAARHPESTQLLILQGVPTQPTDIDPFFYKLMKTFTWGPIAELVIRTNLSTFLLEQFPKKTKEFALMDKETQQRLIDITLKTDKRVAVDTLREIGQDVGEDIAKIRCPVIIVDGVNGNLVPIMSAHGVAQRFHPDQTSAHEVGRRVAFWPIPGEHGHNIVNTFPEALGGVIDYIIQTFARQGKIG